MPRSDPAPVPASGRLEPSPQRRPSPVPRTRRSGPALLPWQETGWLRVAYLANYDREDEAEIMKLLETAAAMPMRLDREMIRALARQSGLDRLQAKDRSPKGEGLLRNWIDRRRRVGAPVPLWQLGFGGGVPEVDTHIEISLTADWRLWQATRRAAQQELLKRAADAIDAQFTRIEQAARAAGYVMSSPARRRHQHLRWLFLRVRRGMSWTAIAGEVSLKRKGAITPDGVRKAVERLAPLVGIDLPDI